jgi:hypothetical protein
MAYVRLPSRVWRRIINHDSFASAFDCNHSSSENVAPIAGKIPAFGKYYGNQSWTSPKNVVSNSPNAVPYLVIFRPIRTDFDIFFAKLKSALTYDSPKRGFATRISG